MTGERTRGRPRAFDPEAALDRALEVFWAKGYEGASLAELTAAMGINRPSLYAAFGDKQALFRRVLERYRQGPGACVTAALAAAPTAREAVAALLHGSADRLAAPGQPAGCLLVHGALGCSDGAAPAEADAARHRAATELAIRERLDRAAAEGELPPGTDTAALARYVAAVQQGMAVQARTGAAPADLHAIADLALRAWPVA